MPALALPLEPLCPRESERLLVRGVGAPGLRAGPAPEKPGEVRAHSAPPELAKAELNSTRHPGCPRMVQIPCSFFKKEMATCMTQDESFL